MHKVLLGLGSNKGDRSSYIHAAIQKMNDQLGNVSLQASMYKTAAWGKTDQAAFLNTCVLVHTVYGPKMCFKTIKRIEQQLERKSTEHWGPREIDIDILLYDQLILKSQELTIPHTQMHLRNFVMVPSAQIAPQWQHPELNKSLKNLAAICEDPLAVETWSA